MSGNDTQVTTTVTQLTDVAVTVNETISGIGHTAIRALQEIRTMDNLEDAKVVADDAIRQIKMQCDLAAVSVGAGPDA